MGEVSFVPWGDNPPPEWVSKKCTQGKRTGHYHGKWSQELGTRMRRYSLIGITELCSVKCSNSPESTSHGLSLFHEEGKEIQSLHVLGQHKLHVHMLDCLWTFLQKLIFRPMDSWLRCCG